MEQTDIFEFQLTPAKTIKSLTDEKIENRRKLENVALRLSLNCIKKEFAPELRQNVSNLCCRVIESVKNGTYERFLDSSKFELPDNNFEILREFNELKERIEKESDFMNNDGKNEEMNSTAIVPTVATENQTDVIQSTSSNSESVVNSIENTTEKKESSIVTYTTEDIRNEEMNSTTIVPEVTTETLPAILNDTNTEHFLNRIFHATDPELYTYLVQFDNVNKKIGHCQYFQIKDSPKMVKSVSALNIKPFGLSYSMGLLDKNLGKKAATKDIISIPCLWCDIDIKSAVHTEENLFESVEDIMTMFEKLKPRGLYPDMIVHSGYGVHAYWIFDKPILTQFTDEMLDPKSLLTKIQSIVRQLAKSFTVDKTDNLDRVLRVVGSKNWKDPSSVPTARIIHEKQHTYDAEEIAILIDDAITTLNEQKYTSNVTSPISDKNMQAVDKMRNRGISESLVTNGDVQIMIDNCSFIRHVIENFNTTSEPMVKDALSNLLRSSNGHDFAIQLCKKRFGVNFDEDRTRERLGHYLTQKPTSCTKIHQSCTSCNLGACSAFQMGLKVPAAIVTSPDVRKSFESIDKTLGDVIDDVPPDISHFHIPFGYSITDSGIFDVSKNKPATRSLCFISKVITEFDAWNDRKTFYELTAMTNHTWNRFELPAELVKESRSVTSILAAKGIKIDSNCAKYAVSFFTAFESDNEDLIPHVIRYTKTGWNSNQFIIQRDDNFPRDDNNLFEVNAGESSKLIHSHGNRGESLNLILDARKFNAVRTMIDAALAATIIQKLNCNNFAVNFWGRSGTGKTASLRLANSLFAEKKFVVDFHSTDNALVNAFTERNDLPTFLNEYQLTSRKNKEDSGGDIIHRFESGESKKRLDRSAKPRPIQHFNGVMCITAEQKILNDNAEGGKIRRLLEIHFDKEIPHEMCSKFYSSTRDNYGFIAREFIHCFESDSTRFDFAKSKRDMFETMIRESCKNIVDSHIDYISILTLVDFLFQIQFENIDEQTATENALHYALYLIQFAITKDELSDSQRARSYIIDWFARHEMNFLRSDQKDSRIVREIYGYYDHTDNTPMIIPSVLKDALKNAGFSPNKILAEWNDEGVISYDEKLKAYSKVYRCVDGINRRLTELTFLRQDKNKQKN